MRPSVVRLIFNKEVRDLLRDRRTVMLVLVVPALLYPLFGIAGYAMAQSLLGQTTTVGIVGTAYLPDEPKLYAEGKFVDFSTAVDSDPNSTPSPLAVLPLDGEAEEMLRSKKIDVAVIVPEGFREQIADAKLTRPTIQVLNRDGDEKSKLAAKRLVNILQNWERTLRTKRFESAGLPKGFETIFDLDEPNSKKPALKKAADELRDSFVKVFPFILIMWLVAGAIQPAVDTTAGERERGTMETLLISPATRGEIVVGKWAATTLFGFASVIWNVVWLAGGAIVMQFALGYPIVNLLGLIGCVVLGLPLAMLFAAFALALGIFAKSTKEGQYYLIPLMLVTMPLAFLSMMPGRELTAGTALMPVTGAMLFQQKLLTPSADPIPWAMAPLVLGSLFVVVAIALRIAVVQFNRESVLFREAAGGGFFARK